VPDSLGQGSDPSFAAPIPALFYPGVEVVLLGGRVHGVWLHGSGHVTSKDLGVGDLLQRAERLYGPSRPVSTIPPGVEWLVTEATDSAMLFVIVDSGRVKSLYVGKGID
jgi:hypothetical protein